MTNIEEDHIGQDGIESVEDLILIKSLVAERVKAGGTLIINAADPRLVAMTQEPRVRKVPKRIVYFSIDPECKGVTSHLRAGGTAYYVKRGWIVEANGPTEHLIAPLDSLSVTFGGTARYQIENLLAAIAACRSHKVARADIAPALKRFDSALHNPGRTNLFKVGHGHVLVDYGHNAAAFAAVSDVVSQWSTRVTGIIGVPGDRNNGVVELAGCTAAKGFSRLFIKEDKDLRGRQAGEVATLLCQAAFAAEPEKECRIILDELEAFERALVEMVEGETIVLFYEDLEPVHHLIALFGGVPADLNRARVARQQREMAALEAQQISA